MTYETITPCCQTFVKQMSDNLWKEKTPILPRKATIGVVMSLVRLGKELAVHDVAKRNDSSISGEQRGVWGGSVLPPRTPGAPRRIWSPQGKSSVDSYAEGRMY